MESSACTQKAKQGGEQPLGRVDVVSLREAHCDGSARCVHGQVSQAHYSFDERDGF